MGLKLTVLTPEPEKKSSDANACFIDMVQTVRPGGHCKENCLHCGAFEVDSVGGQKELSRAELNENLTERIRPLKRDNRPDESRQMEILGDDEALRVRRESRGKMRACYLAPYVTTDVDTEPMNGDAFLHAADLINSLTEGRSKLLCISHGVRSAMIVNGSYLGHVRQIFSLFGYHNGKRYSEEEWRGCLLKLNEWGVADDVKESVYAAFVNNMIMLGKCGAEEEQSSLIASGILEKIKNSNFMPEIDSILKPYLDAEELEDSSVLMINQIAITDALTKNGMMKEVCTEADRESAGRLYDVVEMIQKGIVPGFILTIDFARELGRMPLENNMASYVKTLKILRPIMNDDCPGFFAVSIQGLQGDDVPSDNPYTAERAMLFFQQVMLKAGLTREERRNIDYDKGRGYMKVGRAAEDSLLSKYLDKGDACEVIPCQQFVTKVIAPDRKIARGILCADGSAKWQYVEDGATYNTTIEGSWEPFLDVPAVREYTQRGVERSLEGEIGTVVLLTPEERERKRHFNWEQEIGREDDIFLIQPFSALKRKGNVTTESGGFSDRFDRKVALGLVRDILGVENICGCQVGEGDRKRKIRFMDLKSAILKAYYPGEDISARVVHEASPYAQFEEAISDRGLNANARIGEYSWYTGEIIAVARILEEMLGIDYLVDTLEEVYTKRKEVEKARLEGEESDCFAAGSDGIIDMDEEAFGSDFEDDLDTEPDPLKGPGIVETPRP